MFKLKETALKPVSLILLGLLALSVVPYAPFSAHLPFVYLILMWIVLSESFNIMAGYTGYICFGQVVFYGIGATAAGLLTWLLNIHPLLSALAGGLAAALLSLGVGYLTLRLRGPYFAIVTAAVNEAMMTLILYLFPFGIMIPPTLYDPLATYYSMLVLAMAVVALTYLIAKSKIGLALTSILEDEDAALTLGVNTQRYKIQAFLLSALPTGIAGGLDIWRSTYISAEGAFSIVKSVDLITMCMFGGSGTITGPVIGAVILYTFKDFFWARFPFLHLMIYGALLMAIILFIPGGIIGLLKRKIPKLNKQSL